MINYIPNKPLYTIINDTKISIDNYVTNNELNIIRLINDYSLGNNYELYIAFSFKMMKLTGFDQNFLKIIP